MLFQCPHYQRADFIAKCASKYLQDILNNKESAQVAVKWLVQLGTLP